MNAALFRTALAVLPVLAAGCAADAPAPVPTAPPTMASHAAGPLSCQSVVFTSVLSGTFPTFTGTMTGDLEGTVLNIQDANTVEVRGPFYARVDGAIDFNVTGGTIPELIGQSFRTSAVSSNRFAPDADPTIGEVGGRVRAVDGVSAANLTFHGFVDVTDGVPPFEVRLLWHGVICT